MWRKLLAVRINAPITLAASPADATMAIHSTVTRRHVPRKVNFQFLLKGMSFMLAYIIIFSHYLCVFTIFL